ncbi:MAG: UDP-glucose/GDP-mannose dehydrogenase family protein [Planctomycetes bacterium]|nr:UDP-glucose/GDP-mannose dehydrogenase family protein [Planctomycetota bacterium]
MHIAIFGTGYVGLVTGVCFAEMGNVVTCVDVDPKKVDRLRRGEVPIYEPGLQELLEENFRAKRIRFTTLARDSLVDAEIAFICVGTPMSDSGEADLKYVEAASRDIGRNLNHYCLIVTKSTVPVGTADKVRGWVRDELAQRASGIEFDVASNPEFLKEGSAVDDFMKPDRVVVGVDSDRADKRLHDLYGPFVKNGLRFYTMDIRSAEMTKYAANAMLATKISFINEIANLCERVGADVRQVRLGVGADVRIGLQFLHPGCGYGGSCFPKDVKALIHTADSVGYRAELMHAVDSINNRQKVLIQRKLQAWCELHGRRINEMTVAVWGLAFKPNTDDVRESPALPLVQDLLRLGAKVRVHDPKAMEEAKKILGTPDGLIYVEDQYKATEGADVLCLVTEWRPYRRPDFDRLAGQLRAKVIFDGRNQYDEIKTLEHGLTVYPVGVPTAKLDNLAAKAAAK